MEKNLEEISNSLGIEKGEINRTLRMKRRQSFLVFPLVSFLFGPRFDALGGFYGGIGGEDFKRLPRFIRWILGIR